MDKNSSKIQGIDKKNPLFLPIILIIISAVLSGGLFGYSKIIQEGKKKNLTNEINAIQSEIIDFNSKETNKYLALIDKNYDALNEKYKLSRMQDFIAEVDFIKQNYNLNISSFSYSGGKISMETKAQTGNNSEAYEKIVKFIGDYEQKLERKLTFKLEDVTSLIGEEEITFTISGTPVLKDLDNSSNSGN